MARFNIDDGLFPVAFGGVYSLLDRPRRHSFGAAKPPSEHFLADSGVPSKIGKRICLPPIFKKNVCRPVVGLLLSRRPSAIRRLIISIIVRPPIKRMRRAWPLPHVSKKIAKISPPLAYGDALRLVIEKRWVACLCTSRDHIRPATIRRASPVAGSGCVPVCTPFAPAAFRLTMPEFGSAQFPGRSANAFAYKYKAVFAIPRKLFYRPVPEYRANHLPSFFASTTRRRTGGDLGRVKGRYIAANATTKPPRVGFAVFDYRGMYRNNLPIPFSHPDKNIGSSHCVPPMANSGSLTLYAC